MEVRITQMSGGADDLAALYRRLLGRSELRGRVSARSLPPAPGSTDGFILESLLVTIPPGDDADPLLDTVVGWFTQSQSQSQNASPGPARTGGRTVICLSRADGSSFELTAADFEGLTPGEQRSQIDQLAKLLSD